VRTAVARTIGRLLAEDNRRIASLKLKGTA
jgi:hypothetical protein